MCIHLPIDGIWVALEMRRGVQHELGVYHSLVTGVPQETHSTDFLNIVLRL